MKNKEARANKVKLQNEKWHSCFENVFMYSQNFNIFKAQHLTHHYTSEDLPDTSMKSNSDTDSG